MSSRTGAGVRPTQVLEVGSADIPALLDVLTRMRESAYTLDELRRLGITEASVADRLAATCKGGCARTAIASSASAWRIVRPENGG